MRYIFILINEIAYLLAQSAFIALVIIFSINILDLGITIYQKKLLEKEEILFLLVNFAVCYLLHLLKKTRYIQRCSSSYRKYIRSRNKKRITK